MPWLGVEAYSNGNIKVTNRKMAPEFLVANAIVVESLYLEFLSMIRGALSQAAFLNYCKQYTCEDDVTFLCAAVTID
jgi:hypothetical protein